VVQCVTRQDTSRSSEPNHRKQSSSAVVFRPYIAALSSFACSHNIETFYDLDSNGRLTLDPAALCVLTIGITRPSRRGMQATAGPAGLLLAHRYRKKTVLQRCIIVSLYLTRSQAVDRIADRTASQHLWGSRDVIRHVTIR